MMGCLVYDGDAGCVWCGAAKAEHPYRWCSRCKGDGCTPDPLDRESQLEGLPSWAWKQIACQCLGGIVTVEGEPLSVADRFRLESSQGVRDDG